MKIIRDGLILLGISVVFEYIAFCIFALISVIPLSFAEGALICHWIDSYAACSLPEFLGTVAFVGVLYYLYFNVMYWCLPTITAIAVVVTVSHLLQKNKTATAT